MLSAVAALVLLPSLARSLRPRLYFALLAAFFVFAGISTLWSPQPHVFVAFDFAQMKFAVRSEIIRLGLLLLAQGALIGAALQADDTARTRVRKIAHIALFTQLGMLVVLAAFEQQLLDMLRPLVPDTGEGVQNISRNSLIMSIAAPVLALGIVQKDMSRKSLAIALGVIVTTAAILAIRGVHAGLLAMGLAGVAIALVHYVPRHAFRIMSAATAVLIMTAPLVVGLFTRGADFATANDSATYRAAIWDRVIAIIGENPITGGGLGILRTVREPIETGMFAGQFTVPNHAHNMLLQLWVETGAIGAALLSAAIVLLGWRLPAADRLGFREMKGAAVGGGMLAVAAVSFDLWNEWWWAVGGLMIVLACMTPRTSPESGGLQAGAR
jgi:exopolysaccharide production protein ExoQ